MREVCAVSEWAYDEVRTDCRLERICTNLYGQRACYRWQA
jgi:hypothetical protein